MQWINSVFSADPMDLSRVSVLGCAVTVLGVAVFIIVPRLMKKLELPVKLVGIAITVLGALLTMKII